MGEMNIENIPEYFICPISLQIMKDPVTAVSGITYDRDSIEHWLFDTHHSICPVTKQPLPANSDFLITPNHTLRRLIQAWSTVNSPYAGGGDEITPTPKTPLTKSYVANLVRKLRIPSLQMKTLQKLEALAAEMNERNRVCMVEAGLAEGLFCFVVSCYKSGESNNGLEVALSILYTIRVLILSTDENDDEIMDSLMWVFGLIDSDSSAKLKLHASHVLKSVVQNSNPRLLERLKPDFFRDIGSYLRGGENINALLYVLSEACKWGRNRAAMVEAGVVSDLVEVELRRSPAAPEKRTTELVLGVIHQLCSCAEGRAQLLSHAAGVAVVTRRILKVSPAADERAVMIVWLISKHSATSGVVTEMLRVGTVAKLCIVMQANCGTHLKEKARDILRTHCTVWKDSPCVEVATLTRFTR